MRSTSGFNHFSLTSKQTWLVIALLSLCLAAVVGTAEERVALVKSRPASEARMLHDLQYLASDELQGRGIGTKGLEEAADFIRQTFTDANLNVHPAGAETFQNFDVNNGALIDGENKLQLTGPDGKIVALKYDQEFRTCSFGDSKPFAGELVFLGYGIQSKDPQYDDYAKVDVKNKVVIVLRRTPQQEHPRGLFATAHGISPHAELRSKVRLAAQQGASAMLLVNDPFTGRESTKKLHERLKVAREKEAEASTAVKGGAGGDAAVKTLEAATRHREAVETLVKEDDPDPLLEFGYGGTRSSETLPVLNVSQATLNRVLETSIGKTLARLEAEIDASGQPFTQLIPGWSAQGETHFKLSKIPVKNVLASLEGTGPLAEETIVIGAHYDHLGLGGEGSLSPGVKEIHNGADDNASGSAALLELARRFGSRSEKLPRRLLFIAFTGEERGLLGSALYCKQPLYPLEKTVAMFNLDMVGRLADDRLTVFGCETSPVWNPLLDAAAVPTGLNLSKKPEGFGPSDHSSFYAKKIPVLHLFTGTHSDYHRPSDDWQKLNVGGMARIVEFLEQIVVTTAKSQERPSYVEVVGKATLDKSGNRPYFGSIPDFNSDAKGYAINGVAAESPAAKGGLLGGDVIVRLGDRPIEGLDDFDSALRTFSAGDEVTVRVLRQNKEIDLRVTLGKPRGG